MSLIQWSYAFSQSLQFVYTNVANLRINPRINLGKLIKIEDAALNVPHLIPYYGPIRLGLYGSLRHLTLKMCKVYAIHVV